MTEEEINGCYNPQMTMHHEKMYSWPPPFLQFTPLLFNFSYFTPLFILAEAFSFISLMSFVVPLAEDDFVLAKGADSSDNSPDRDGRHKPQHGETNEREE